MRYLVQVERDPDRFEGVVADGYRVEQGFVSFYKDTGQFRSTFVIGYPAHSIFSWFPEDK